MALNDAAEKLANAWKMIDEEVVDSEPYAAAYDYINQYAINLDDPEKTHEMLIKLYETDYHHWVQTLPAEVRVDAPEPEHTDPE